MTEEQKDWFEYGKLMCAYKYVRQEEPESVHLIIPIVWAARKKAHRWLDSGCDNCKFSELKESEFPCGFCTGNKGYWQPKDE